VFVRAPQRVQACGDTEPVDALTACVTPWRGDDEQRVAAPSVTAHDLLRSGAPFIADTSAWWRVISLPVDLAALVQDAVRNDRLWITAAWAVWLV